MDTSSGDTLMPDPNRMCKEVRKENIQFSLDATRRFNIGKYFLFSLWLYGLDNCDVSCHRVVHRLAELL